MAGEKWPPRPANEFQKLQTEWASVDGPFWRKPKHWKDVVGDRKIPVSVLHHDSLWSFKGAGIVRASRQHCMEKAKNFERLREIPEHFKEVSFNSETSTLHLKIQFLGRTREMDLALFEESLAEDGRIFFKSVKGWLPGLEGSLLFKDQAVETIKDQQRQATEIGIIAYYPGEIPWIPDWLFSLATEAVMHHVAETLRKSLESDYKN